jgi:hypothetical protein
MIEFTIEKRPYMYPAREQGKPWLEIVQLLRLQKIPGCEDITVDQLKSKIKDIITHHTVSTLRSSDHFVLICPAGSQPQLAHLDRVRAMPVDRDESACPHRAAYRRQNKGRDHKGGEAARGSRGWYSSHSIYLSILLIHTSPA